MSRSGLGWVCLFSNGGVVGRKENFVQINLINSSSFPQSLLVFSPDVTNLSLGTSETFSLF